MNSPLIGLWGNMQMLTVLHKPIKTTQFFQEHGHSPICADHAATDDRGSRGGHLRSNDAIIRFSLISRDRMEIETHKWCQTSWLVQPLSMMCILTYLGHDLTLTWSWPEMTRGQIFKSTFQGQKAHVSNRLNEAKYIYTKDIPIGNRRRDTMLPKTWTEM